MSPEERATLARVRALLSTLDEGDALAIIYARSLRPTLRNHAMKKRLRNFDAALRKALTGRPVR
jgi:hypothetical protein